MDETNWVITNMANRRYPFFITHKNCRSDWHDSRLDAHSYPDEISYPDRMSIGECWRCKTPFPEHILLQWKLLNGK